MASLETRERIIATAARLFAQYGYHGVSLRQIAKETGVQASLAQYHFKNKESVFRAVFERCILPINHNRINKLDQLTRHEAEGREISLDEISTGPALAHIPPRPSKSAWVRKRVIENAATHYLE